MTGGRALHGGRRAAYGYEVAGVEHQIAGAVVNETVAKAQPIVAGVDANTVMIRR